MYTIQFKIAAISTNDTVIHGKSNLASNDVEDIDLPIVFVSIASKDSEVLLTPINKISHSKRALILYGRVQGFMIELSAVRAIWEVGHSPLPLKL